MESSRASPSLHAGRDVSAAGGSGVLRVADAAVFRPAAPDGVRPISAATVIPAATSAAAPVHGRQSSNRRRVSARGLGLLWRVRGLQAGEGRLLVHPDRPGKGANLGPLVEAGQGAEIAVLDGLEVAARDSRLLGDAVERQPARLSRPAQPVAEAGARVALLIRAGSGLPRLVPRPESGGPLPWPLQI